VKSQRPMFLDLTKMRFPITAIASILHRVSGVVIFLALPLFMYLLHQSLLSQGAFLQMQHLLATAWMKVVMWAVLTAVTYHLLAGLRHIVMDFGFLESLSQARKTAYLVIVLAVVLSVAIGVWLC